MATLIVKEIVESANTGDIAVEYVDESTRVYNKADVAVYSYNASGVVNGLLSPDGSTISLVGSGSLNEVATNTTGTVTFSGNGQPATPLNASVDISATAGNSITISAGGLYVAPVLSSITANDTLSIDMSGDGSVGSPLTAAVKLSSTANNAITNTATGVYVPEASVTTATSTTVQFTGTGTAASNLSAAVKVSPAVGNTLTSIADGLYNPIPTVTSSASNNVTLSGLGTAASPLIATAVVDVAADNILTSSATGLYVAPITVYNSDTSTVDFSGAGTSASPLTASVKLGSDVGNVLVNGTGGLLVPTPTITSLDSTSVNFSGTGAPSSALTADIVISGNAGNVLTSPASGLFVPTPTTTTIDSSSIAFNGNGTAATPLTSSVIISPDVGNTLTSQINGLYSPNPADTVQTAAATGATTILAWSSVVLIPTLTANITLTYPTPVGNIGKNIKVVQAGTPNAFTITHTPAVGSIAFTNVANELSTVNGAITVEAVDASNLRQVSNSAPTTPPAETIQQLNATGSVAAWGSVVEIGATPLVANITITLPTCSGNVGKKVTFKRLDSTAFTVTIAGDATDTVEVTTPVVLSSQYGALTIEAVSTTKSEQVSSIGVGVFSGDYSGVVRFSADTNTNLSTITSTNVSTQGTLLTTANRVVLAGATVSGTLTVNATNGTIAIAKAGYYSITVILGIQSAGTTGQYGQLVKNNTTILTACPSYSQANSAGMQVALTYSGVFATGDLIDARLNSTSAGTIGVMSYSYSVAQNSGFLPVIGSMVEYITAANINVVTTNIAAGDHAKFDQVLTTGGVTLDTTTAYTSAPNVASLGRFTLKAGKTYKLAGHLGDIVYSPNTTNFVAYRWFNSDASISLGGQVTVSSDFTSGSNYDGSGGTADAIFTPSVDTRVELRIFGAGQMTGYGGALASSKAYAEIIQIGSTATTGNAFNSLVGATVANTVDNTALDQSWNWSTATTGNPLALSAPALTTGSLLSLTPSANAIGLTNNGRSFIQVGTTTNTTPDLATGTINDFLERKIKNTSAGTAAQTGYTAESDTGAPTSGFAWMGINNSAFANPQLYNAGVAGDVTFVGSGQSLILANASQTQPIRFQTGKAASPFFDDRMVILNSGLVGVGTATPLTNLDVIGSSSRSYTTTAAAAYTILISDSVVNLSLAGAQTVTMPAAASFSRRIITVRNPTTTSKLFAAVYTTLLGATATAIPAGSSLTLQSNGSVWQVIDESNRVPNVQTFTASGTYTPTQGMKSAIVELVGGGAGGRPSIAALALEVSVGGGGGNGGYIKALVTAAQIGASQVVTIGAGGAAATNGGNTTFGALLNAGFGAVSSAVATSGTIRAEVGGLGGAATVTTGVALATSAGAQSTAYGFVSGSFHLGVIAQSGGTVFGAGALPQTSAGTTSATLAGNSASANTGCGGNGGYSALLGAAAAGGTGGSGILTVTEFF